MKTSLAGLLCQKWPKKGPSQKVKNWKKPSKSVTAFLKIKVKKLKHVLKKRDGPSQKSKKLKNVLNNRYSSLQRKKLKNVLKRRYGPSQKKVKNWKMSSKTVWVLLKKSDKLKNFLPFHDPPWYYNRRRISTRAWTFKIPILRFIFYLSHTNCNISEFLAEYSAFCCPNKDLNFLFCIFYISIININIF